MHTGLEMTTQLVRPHALAERLSISLSSLWAAEKRGEFPPRIKIGDRAAAFVESEVEQILTARIAGASSDEIRRLVQRIVAGRSALAQ
jgi:prophage regulatory protein